MFFHVSSGFSSFSGLTWWYMIGSAMIWKWIVISHLRVAGLLRKIFAIRSDPTTAPNSTVGLDPQARNWTHAKSQFNLMMVLNTRSIPQNRSQIMLDPKWTSEPRSFFPRKQCPRSWPLLLFFTPWALKDAEMHCLSSPEMIAKCTLLEQLSLRKTWC